MFKFGKYGKSLGDLNFISFLSLFFFLIFALISIPNSLDAQSDTCYVKKIYKSKIKKKNAEIIQPKQTKEFLTKTYKTCNGLEVELTIFSDKIPTHKTSYTYDQHQNLIKEIKSFNTKEKNGIDSTIYKYDAFDNLIKKRHFSEDRLRLDSVLYVYDESIELLRETSYTSSNYQSTIEYEKVMDTVFVHRVNIRNYKEIKSIHQTYTDSLRQKWYLLVEPNPKKHKISGLDSFVRKYNEQGDLIETRVINESNEEVTLSKKKIEYDEFNRKVLEKSFNGKIY